MKYKSILFGFWLVSFAASAAAQTTVTTSGTTSSGTVPVFNGTATVTNSQIAVSGSNVGIGTTNPNNGMLSIVGASGASPIGWQAGSARGWQFGSNAGANTSDDVVGLFSYKYSDNHGTNYAPMQMWDPNNSYILLLPWGGNVGIGTTSPAYALDVAGQIHSTTGIVYQDGTTQTTAWTGVLCGGDYAEAMNAAGGKASYQPGDVLVLASGDSDDVQKSSEPYSTMVAGIYATKPGVIGRREALAKSKNDIPMAMVGVVPTKVSAENGPIRKGDLLVSSSTPGYAMRGTDRSRLVGAVIGKAMQPLESGQGVIEVLVTLQ